MPHTHRLDPNTHRSFLAQRRRDPITKEPLRPGDQIIICANDKRAFLATTWNGSCPLCGNTTTLNYVPNNTIPSRLDRQTRTRNTNQHGTQTGGQIQRPQTSTSIWPVSIILVIVCLACAAVVWSFTGRNANTVTPATAEAHAIATAERRATLTAQALIDDSESGKKTATAEVRATATAERKVTLTEQTLMEASTSQKQTATAEARATATAERKVTLTEQARATATAKKRQNATAQARTTATAIARKTATAQAKSENNSVSSGASGVSCSKSAQGEFADFWRTYQNLLGCPIDTKPLYGQFADMPFEKGHLFWIGNIDTYGDFKHIIATYGGQNEGDRGSWSIHPDTWYNEGICNVPPPPEGRYLPDRGIAKVWCEIDGINSLGFAMAPAEFSANRGINAIQNFDDAVVFRDSDGHSRGLVYILFRNPQNYVRVKY